MKGNLKVLFCPMLQNIQNSAALLRFPALPACPSHDYSHYDKGEMGQWCNDNKPCKTKVLRIKPAPMPPSPTQNPTWTFLGSNSSLCCEMRLNLNYI
jgi:hypothetical protein